MNIVYLRRLSIVSLWLLVILAGYYVWKTNLKAETPLRNAQNGISLEPEVINSAVNPSEENRTPENSASANRTSTVELNREVPDFEMINQNGETVSRDDLLGKPWAVCCVFSKCSGPCDKISLSMMKLHQELKDEQITLISLSVDPARDTPEQLKEYASIFGAEGKTWHFLTTEKAKLQSFVLSGLKLPLKEMFGEDRKPGHEFVHSTVVLHINAQGKIQGKYNALNADQMTKLRNELRKEARGLAEKKTHSESFYPTERSSD